MDCVTRYLNLIPNPWNTAEAWTGPAVSAAGSVVSAPEPAVDPIVAGSSAYAIDEAAPVAQSALQPSLGPQAGAADLSHAREVAELERLLADNRAMEAFNELAEGDIPLFLRRSA